MCWNLGSRASINKKEEQRKRFEQEWKTLVGKNQQDSERIISLQSKLEIAKQKIIEWKKLMKVIEEKLFSSKNQIESSKDDYNVFVAESQRQIKSLTDEVKKAKDLHQFQLKKEIEVTSR